MGGLHFVNEGYVCAPIGFCVLAPHCMHTTLPQTSRNCICKYCIRPYHHQRPTWVPPMKETLPLIVQVVFAAHSSLVCLCFMIFVFLHLQTRQIILHKHPPVFKVVSILLNEYTGLFNTKITIKYAARKIGIRNKLKSFLGNFEMTYYIRIQNNALLWMLNPIYVLEDSNVLC